MTNFEKIKNMTVYEIAERLDDGINECELCIYGQSNTCPNTCLDGITAWLESEVENDR